MCFFALISIKQSPSCLGLNSLKMKLNESCHENACFFAYAKTKGQISCMVTAQLISAFVFTTKKVQPLYFLNTKFHASNHLLMAVQPGSCQIWSETPKTGFVMWFKQSIPCDISKTLMQWRDSNVNVLVHEIMVLMTWAVNCK